MKDNAEKMLESLKQVISDLQQQLATKQPQLESMLAEVLVKTDVKTVKVEVVKLPDSYWRCKTCRKTQLVTEKCSKCFESLEKAALYCELEDLLVEGQNQNTDEEDKID